MKKKNDHIDYFELIEEYLDGRMTESDKVLFEKRLIEDNVLAKEFEIRKKLTLLLQGAAEYRQTKGHVNQILNKKKYNKFNYIPIIAIAASIVILVGIFLLIKDNKNNDPELLISETDTTYVLHPGIEKRDSKASLGYYRPFSFIPYGYEVEIVQDCTRIHVAKYHTYQMKLRFTVQPDMTINNAYFYSYDSISVGKYVYIDDSLIGGEQFYKFQSMETNGGKLLVHADSLKVDLQTPNK